MTQHIALMLNLNSWSMNIRIGKKATNIFEQHQASHCHKESVLTLIAENINEKEKYWTE